MEFLDSKLLKHDNPFSNWINNFAGKITKKNLAFNFYCVFYLFSYKLFSFLKTDYIIGKSKKFKFSLKLHPLIGAELYEAFCTYPT
jgi:hypothetical protein